MSLFAFNRVNIASVASFAVVAAPILSPRVRKFIDASPQPFCCDKPHFVLRPAIMQKLQIDLITVEGERPV